MVFLTPSVAADSASRIQFEVITLGREDVWSKIKRYSKEYLFSSFENSYTVCIHSPVAVLPHQNMAYVLKRQKTGSKRVSGSEQTKSTGLKQLFYATWN